ncbi:MAG: outer membrane protein assembly factor BamA [Confluentimicrobium sp.]|nr:outer membrane protein assembly factor BamA [Actibacterium sp.]
MAGAQKTGGRTLVGRNGLQKVAVATFLGLSTASIAGLGPVAAQSYSFTDVVIEGNQRVSPASIVSYAGIGRGEQVSAAQLNAAYQGIVNSGLFETVNIEPRGNTLVITVQEYPTINVINFEGNRRMDDEELQALIKSTSRRVYSPTQAEADAAAITQAYASAGRLAATVEPVIIRRSDNRVDLVFEVTEGKVVEIERLAFAGNRAFSDSRLRRVLSTKQAGIFRALVQSDTFIAERIEFDKQVLRDFYLSRGYIDFQTLSTTTELTRNRNAFLLTFNVREGQQFRLGRVTVTSEIEGVNAAAYRDAIRAGEGSVYSPSILENNVARMETLAVEQGVNFVRVDPQITRNERDLTLDVNYVITRGPRVFVERIDIEGNTTTLDRVVRREFTSVEGDPFNPRAIRQSAERIRALGFFSNAEVQAREGSAPDQVIVDVDVEEQPTGSLGFGVSYGVNTGVGLNASFSESNFLGRGQAISFGINTTTDSRALNFSFAEPAFLGRDLRAGVAFNYRESTSDDADYNTRIGSFGPFIDFPLAERSRLRLRFSGNYKELSNVDTDNSFILQQEEGSYSTGEVGYTYSFDSRNSGLDPNAGVLVRFSQDFGFGDKSYVRTTALVAAEKAVLNEDVTLRAEFEGGALSYFDGGSTVLDRFDLNGKIRGFENNGLGPRDLNAPDEDALKGEMFAVARFEADFPLGLPEEYGINGGVFFDVGSVWGLSDTAGGEDGSDEVDDAFYLRSSLGVSLFWDTPIGPLRFNFAKPIVKKDYDEEQPFDLTISTRF